MEKYITPIVITLGVLIGVITGVVVILRRRRQKLWVLDRIDYQSGWEDDIGQPETLATIYYLDAAGKLREEALENHIAYRRPVQDEPSICLLGFGDKLGQDGWIKEKYFTLIYDPIIRNRWLIDSLDIQEGYAIGIILRDPHGQSVRLCTYDKDNMIYTILRIITDNHCLHDLERQELRKEGVKVLKDSKGSLGKSQALAMLRDQLEAGPERLSQEEGKRYIPDFAHLPVPR